MAVRKLVGVGAAMLLAFGAVVVLPGAARGALIHRYSFKDGAKDSVGHVDGALMGGAKASDGKLSLDNGEKTSGDDGLAYVGLSGPVLPKSGSASIAVWFSGKEVGQFSRLIDIGSKDPDSGGKAFVYMTARTGDDGSRVAISATDPAGKTAVDGPRLDDGNPHMELMVIDGAAKKLHLYIDGKEAGTAADLGDNTLDKVEQDHGWIGRSAFDTDPALTATVNEVRVYDDALTADQAAAIFAAGADVGGDAPAATQPAPTGPGATEPAATEPVGK